MAKKKSNNKSVEKEDVLDTGIEQIKNGATTEETTVELPVEEIVEESKIEEMVEDKIPEDIKKGIENKIFMGSDKSVDNIAIVEIEKGDSKEAIIVDTTDDTKKVDNIVKEKSTQNKPVYQIRLGADNAASDKGSYSNLNDAIAKCNEYAGYSVYNDKGVAIHISTKPVPISSARSIRYAGEKVVLNKAKIYPTASSTSPNKMVSGGYYLYDGVSYGGKYRIVDNRNDVGNGIKNILGYVFL